MSEAATASELAPVVPIINRDDIRLTVLTSEQSVESWDLITPYLDRVFERSAGRIGVEGTLAAVKAGMAEVILVWIPETSIVFAVIVAEGREYPDRKVYSLGLCSGHNIHVWAERMWPALQKHARDSGFDQIEIVGRRGWKRFIPGAKEIATFYAMDLDDGPVREVSKEDEAILDAEEE